MLQLFQKASATTRRFAAVALSFCMLLGIMANPLSGVMGVLAQNTPTVTVGNYTAKPGDTVAVTLDVSNNPGINAVKVQLGFNADVMTMQSYVADGVFPADKVSWGQEGNNPFVVNFADGLTQTNYTVNGKLATLTFKVADNATPGTYPLTLTFDEAYNVDWDEPVFTMVNGSLTVEAAGGAPSCTHTYDDCDDTDCNTCGATREAQAHAYDNDADTTCNNCAHTRNLLPVDPYVAITDNFIVNAGDTIAVPIVVGNNPGINAVKVQLGFNAAVMTMQSYVADGVFPAESVSWGQEGSNPFVVNFADGLTQTNYTVNGKLATLTFKVADDAITGDYPLTLTFDEAYNVDWDEPVFAVVSATVHVEGTACTHNYDNACDADCNTCGATRTPANHVYSNACDADCNVCGATRTPAEHIYNNDCDKTCNTCGATRPITHTYDNACDAVCNVCSAIRTTAGHQYDNNCDDDCNVCGTVRAVSNHVYDNDNDTDCNVCGAVRTIVPKVYGVTAEGWTNEDSQSFGFGTNTLEVGKTYTVSFLWKVDSGAPVVSISGDAIGSDAITIVETDKVKNGASIDRATGRVTYTFVAQGTSVSVGGRMNTGATGYAKYHIADGTITDENDAVVYETTSVALEGWSTGWGNWNGGAKSAFEESLFAGVACQHEYDNGPCDADCNLCGNLREAPGHQYDNYKDADCNVCGGTRVLKVFGVLGQGWSNEASQSYNFRATGLETGKTYTVSFLWKVEAGRPYVRVSGSAIGAEGVMIADGNKAKNNAVIDLATGRVTYTFVAQGDTVSVAAHMNTGETGHDKFYIADGTVLGENNTIVYETSSIDLPDWSTGWGNWTGGTKSEFEHAFFAGTACEHTYDSVCDIDCNNCGNWRDAPGHQYDDIRDAECNVCGYIRPLPVYGLFAQGWVNEATQSFNFHTTGLEVGKEYTVTFLWKVTAGEPRATISGTAVDKETLLMRGMRAKNGATIDYTTGLVTYTFVAQGDTVSVIGYMNSSETGHSAYYMADATIKEKDGAVLFETTTLDLEGWSDGWGNWQGGTKKEFTADFFESTPPADYLTDLSVEGYEFNQAFDVDETFYYITVAPQATTLNVVTTLGADADHVIVTGNELAATNEDSFILVTITPKGGGEDIVYVIMVYRSAAPEILDTVTLEGWTNEHTLGFSTTANGLTAGEQYTLSFLWKVDVGIPYFYAGANTNRIMEGMEAKNGATFDYNTGRVTYTFTAAAEEMGIGFIMNTEDTGHSKVSMADVKITNAQGEVVYKANTEPHPENPEDPEDPMVGWGWTGWGNGWGSTQGLFTFEEKPSTFFDSAPDTLKDLTVDGFTLSPEYKSWITEYTVTVPGETTSLNINTVPYFPGQSVVISGNENFTPDSYTNVTIKVVPLGGKSADAITYTIRVRVAPLTRDALSSLTIKGYEDKFTFDPHVYDYELTVPHTQGALEFDWTLGADAKVGTQPIVYGNGDFYQEKTTPVVIAVENEDGVITNYTISVYMLKNPDDLLTAVQFKEWLQDSSASTALKVRPNTTYAVSFLYKEVVGNRVNVSIGGDALLGTTKNIVANGIATEGVEFDPDTGTYKYVFTAKAEDISLGISANNYSNTNEEGQFEGWVAEFKLYEINPETGEAIEGGHVVAIDNTFAMDDASTEEVEGAWTRPSYGGGFWKVKENVDRAFFAMEYELSLEDILVNGEGLYKFHPANYNYYLTVPYNVTTALIEPVLGDDGESFLVADANGDEIDGVATLEDGENTFIVEVTNYDQTAAVYTIIITKEVEPAATLTDLTIGEYTLSPEFAPNVYLYTATVPFNVTELPIEYQATENAVNVEITGNSNIQVGIPTDVVITVTNESGAKTAYAITVTREGKEGETERLQQLVKDAASKITVNDYTTKEQLTAMLTEALNDNTYTLAVVDFYRLRSVTEVKDNYGMLIEGKDGYLAAVVNITDGEALAQVTITKTIKPETKEYTFTEDDLSTEDEFAISDSLTGPVLDFYTGDAKKVIIPDGVVEIAYGWLDPWDIEAIEVLVIPASVKVLPDDMCLGAFGLETVVMADGLTEMSVGTFAKLPSLQFVRLPETLKIIGSYAFDCSVSLASIRIPESVTAIEGNAFAFTLMREVTVPASVKFIGDGAFSSSFSAAIQLYEGSDNTVRWYPFKSADDPRIAQISARADKEIDWYGIKPTSPVWDTLESAMTEGFGKDELYGPMTSTRKTVTILNKDCEFGDSVFSGQGLWCGAGNFISIANGAPAESQLQTAMEITNATMNVRYGEMNPVMWGTRDMSLAEVTARAMFALDKVTIGATFTEKDVLKALASDYFTTLVTGAIKDFVIDPETKKATGTLVLTQGNMVAELAFSKDVDGNVAPDGGDGSIGGEDGEILVSIIDDTVITIDPETGKLVVAPGATLEAILKALQFAEDVELDFFDEFGNYIPPEYYDVAVIRNGFFMIVVWDAEDIGAFEFAVAGTDTPDDEQPEGEQPEGEKPEGEKPEEELPEVESDLFEVIDTEIILGALDGNKVVVKDGTTLADIIAALKLAAGVEVEVYDALGNYVDPETYGDIVDIDGFVMKLYKDGALTETWTISVLVEDEQPEDDPSVPGEDVENPDDGVTSIATAMILLMAGAAVVLLALRRRKTNA